MKKLTKCQCCTSKQLQLILDLGNQPLANTYLEEPEDLPRYPLKLMKCDVCWHLQLSHVINPTELFSNYIYVSGTTKTLKRYFNFFASYAVEQYKEFNYYEKSPKTVLDIASNDCSQLDSFEELGLETYGIDPARNLFNANRNKGHNLTCGFYPQDAPSKQFDIITAQNVFAHTENIYKFLKQCDKNMHDDSLLFIQTSQAHMMLNSEFDAIYHEHIHYFHPYDMWKLTQRTNLYIEDIRKFDIHGISYVFTLSKRDNCKGSGDFPCTPISRNFDFQDSVDKIVDKLTDVLDEYEDMTVIGYGAAAKANTLLNYIDERRPGLKLLDYIVDDNPLKWDKFTPGTEIPILNPDILKKSKEKQIIFVPLSWNFFDEIKTKIKQRRNNKKDKFLRYFPEVQLHE